MRVWLSSWKQSVCVCVYLKPRRMRLRADSVSSAAPPLSSGLPCTWNRTTTADGTFPETQSKSNTIFKNSSIRGSSYSLIVCGQMWWGLVWISCCNWVHGHHRRYIYIYFFNVFLDHYQRKSSNLVWLTSYIIDKHIFITYNHHVAPLGAAGCSLLVVLESATVCCSVSLTPTSYFFPLVLLLPHLSRLSFPAHHKWTAASPALPAQTRSDLVKHVPLTHLNSPRYYFLTWALLRSSSSSSSSSFLLCLLTLALCLTRFSCSRGRSCSSWTLLLSSRNSGQNFNSSLNTDIYMHRDNAHILSHAVRHSLNHTLVHTKKTQPGLLWRCMGPAPCVFPECAGPVQVGCLSAGRVAWRSW